MSEQNSEAAGVRGANRYIDHELDKLSRTNLFRNLERMRMVFGLTQVQVSTAAGRNPDWLKELGTTDSYYWKYNDIHDWAGALNIAVRFNTIGLPVLPENRMPALALVAETNPAFSGVAMLEYFKSLRDYLCYEQKVIAQRMGVNHGTMYAIEKSDNPRLSTLQRYARALGGALLLEGQPYPAGARKTNEEPF